MKTRILVCLTLGIAIGLVAIVTVRGRHPAERTAAWPQPARANQSLTPSSTTAATLERRRLDNPTASSRPTATSHGDGTTGGPQSRHVSVAAGTHLARVNGKEIRLGQLVPLAGEEADCEMTSEEYASRLKRAIETELTFQEATARNIGLTSVQEERLARLAERHETSFESWKAQGLSWRSSTPAQSAFEQRVASALMLQQNLVAKEVGESPARDANQQARYEAARQRLLARLKSEAKIDLPSAAM